MYLYHYVRKGNNVLDKGLLSFAKSHDVNLRDYLRRSGQTEKDGIIPPKYITKRS